MVNTLGLLVAALLLSSVAHAQPREGQLLDLAVGRGLSSAYDDSDVRGTGMLLKAEYVLAPSAWVALRPYAGVLMTWRDETDAQCDELHIRCEVTSTIALLGAKGRLAIPIPWIAPFIELGLGASAGIMRTHTPTYHRELTGLALHIPVSLGLSIGPDHNVDLAFVFYFHPALRQANGGYTISVTLPLDSP